MEEDANENENENVLQPCHCNIMSVMTCGMYVAASLSAGVIFLIMVTDKALYGQCRFLSVVNFTSGDNLNIDAGTTTELCNGSMYFMAFVCAYSALTLIMHWLVGCQGLTCWSVFQVIAGSILVILLMVFASMITVQLFLFCGNFRDYSDSLDAHIAGCWQQVKHYEMTHADQKDYMQLFKSSLTVTLTTSWMLALIWLTITGVHLGKTCTAVFKLKLNLLKKKLDRQEAARVSDFGANVNSNYNKSNEHTPLLESQQRQSKETLAPFMRALNNVR